MIGPNLLEAKQFDILVMLYSPAVMFAFAVWI